jgi:prepilin-type N-terminal cleavage/methylation domain-containing protein
MKAKASQPAGFTLVELLVAMAILAVILVGTVQITGIARNSVLWAEKKIASDSGARQLSALLERDLREMIRRPDAPFEFQVQPGNDALAFLATRAGYARGEASAGRSASLVRYGSDPDGRITRACLGFGFEGDDLVLLDPAAALPAIPDENRQVVSDTVFRIEFEFLVDDSGRVVRQQKAPATLESLRGIVTTVAVLDPQSRGTLAPGDLAKLTALFPDSRDAESPASSWTAIILANTTRGLSGIPAGVFRGVRVYEQTLLLD